MSKLDDILSIYDRHKRQQALAAYAASVGVDTGQARSGHDEYNEEKLAILIYDSLNTKKTGKRSNFNFLGLGVIIFFVMMAAIAFLPKVFVSMYEEETERELAKEKKIQAFDESGKPVMENGKPVTYSLMEGLYKEYNPAGWLQYEYFYDDGDLLWKKEYNIQGKLITQEDYVRE